MGHRELYPSHADAIVRAFQKLTYSQLLPQWLLSYGLNYRHIHFYVGAALLHAEQRGFNTCSKRPLWRSRFPRADLPSKLRDTDINILSLAPVIISCSFAHCWYASLNTQKVAHPCTIPIVQSQLNALQNSAISLLCSSRMKSAAEFLLVYSYSDLRQVYIIRI